jgi:hypothetical protein
VLSIFEIGSCELFAWTDFETMIPLVYASCHLTTLNILKKLFNDYFYLQ